MGSKIMLTFIIGGTWLADMQACYQQILKLLCTSMDMVSLLLLYLPNIQLKYY